MFLKRSTYSVAQRINTLLYFCWYDDTNAKEPHYHIIIMIHACTMYIIFAGVILAYGLVQLVLWITFHAISLCWGILFPFHFRQMKLTKKLKYVHISTVLVALLLPIIPALLLLFKDGYVIIDTPTTFCAGRSLEYTF